MAHERTTVSSSAATTRESILLAALRLFSRNGYEGTSMRDIAGEVGISQGAIYKHFAGKDALLEAICTRMEENDATHTEAAGAWRKRLVALLRLLYLHARHVLLLGDRSHCGAVSPHD